MLQDCLIRRRSAAAETALGIDKEAWINNTLRCHERHALLQSGDSTWPAENTPNEHPLDAVICVALRNPMLL